MRHATILVAILAFVPLASATAQVQPPPVERGTRVRVTLCPRLHIRCLEARPRHYVGTFVTWNADTLVVEGKGDTLAVPQDSVITLEVSTGRGYSKKHVELGGIIGLLVGTSGGIAIAAAIAPEEGCLKFDSKERERDKGTCRLIGGSLGFVVGVLVGMGIGSTIPGDLWEEVPLSRLRVSLGPQRDGRFGLGASVRF